MNKYVLGLTIATAVLMGGCNKEATELEQVRMKKEIVEAEAKELKYPYKEIKAYLESEEADQEIIEKIEGIPGFPLMDHVKGGTGATVAEAGMKNINEVKEVNEFEPLEEWLTDTEKLFKTAYESGDEEVEYDQLKDAQKEIEKIKEFIPLEMQK